MPMSDEKVFLRVEVNWKLVPVANETLVGEIDRVMLPGGGV